LSTSHDKHADTPTGGDDTVPARGARPYWIGILVSTLGALWLYGSTSLPQGARYAAVGPGLMVTVAGGALFVLGIILMIQIARGERFEPQDAEDAAANSPMDPRAFFTALLAAVIPVFALPRIGLPVTAMISFTLVARAFGSKKLLLDLAMGLILGCAAWYLFGMLGLQLGPFFTPLGW
jgi:putative tricarboxylic transport membrane protein